MQNRIQYALRPRVVTGLNNDNAKTMCLAFHPDTVRIIDMQIDSECGRKL